MSRETWNLIKQTKQFYVNTYRKIGSALILSVFINIALGLGIYHVYFSQPGHDFYATSGITPPVKLTYMDEPNNSSMPLLANDSEAENEIKVIPQ